MAQEHASNQKNLPALLDGVWATGGLKVFGNDDNNPFGEYVLKAEGIFERLNITTAKQLIQIILLVHSLDDRNTVGSLLSEGMKRGVLHKQDLVTMYLWQSEPARLYHPLLTLEDLMRIPQFASHRKNGDEAAVVDGFSKEEIISLAERVKSVNAADLNMFFQHWFYRDDSKLPFSKEFLLRYYEKERDMDGKLASLVAIGLFNTYPECVKFDDIRERMLSLAMIQPHSHGIFRYLSLLFWIDKGDAHKRTKAIDSYVELVIMLVHYSKGYFPGPGMALELFLRETSITEEEKKAGLVKIEKACKEKAALYANLIEESKRAIKEL